MLDCFSRLQRTSAAGAPAPMPPSDGASTSAVSTSAGSTAGTSRCSSSSSVRFKNVSSLHAGGGDDGAVGKNPSALMSFPLLAAAAMSGFARRLAGIPWREIAGDAFSRAFLIAQGFCAVHVVHSHVCSFALVRGASMLPAMNMAGDVVAVDRVSARLGRVEPGDVVLLISPENPRKMVTKRVLGMEGDAVTYLVDPGNSEASKTVVVPQGHVWVQGDNIYSSRDSRQFGPVPYGLITGKIFCRVWPLKNFGSIDSKE